MTYKISKETPHTSNTTTFKKPRKARCNAFEFPRLNTECRYRKAKEMLEAYLQYDLAKAEGNEEVTALLMAQFDLQNEILDHRRACEMGAFVLETSRSQSYSYLFSSLDEQIRALKNE